MITCDNGDMSIRGTMLEVTLNYMQITDELLRVTPEVVIGMLDARSDIVEKKLQTIDPYDLVAACGTTKNIRFKE